MGKYGDYIYEPEFIRKFRNGEILVIDKPIKPLAPADVKEVA
jgi:choline kinase|tara:strand:+ start:55 stop:180 length:126 start_codon:yes stop_codon:yes gene_type:complete